MLIFINIYLKITKNYKKFKVKVTWVHRVLLTTLTYEPHGAYSLNRFLVITIREAVTSFDLNDRMMTMNEILTISDFVIYDWLTPFDREGWLWRNDLFLIGQNCQIGNHSRSVTSSSLLNFRFCSINHESNIRISCLYLYFLRIIMYKWKD